MEWPSCTNVLSMAIQRGKDLPVPMLIHGYTERERPTETNANPRHSREGTTYLHQCSSMAIQRGNDLRVPFFLSTTIQSWNDLRVPILIHGYTERERPTCTDVNPWLNSDGTTYLHQCWSMAIKRGNDLPLPMLIHGYTERERPTCANFYPCLYSEGTTYLNQC